MPLGYRVVSYDLLSLSAKSLMSNLSVDLKIGSVHEYENGLYLGTDEQFTQYYLGNTDNQDVILEFEYSERDIISGSISPNSEILVKQGVLVGKRFADEEVSQKFGHLLDPKITEDRRNRIKGEPVKDKPKIVTVIRAMDARGQHIHPMDYVYLLDSGALYSIARRVLHKYTEGLKVTTTQELAIMKTLEHAVTTAIYEGVDQRVGFSILRSDNVFLAPNSGEYFYDGSFPISVKTLFTVTPDGQVNLMTKHDSKHEISI